MSLEKLFVYGTLMPGEPSFSAIRHQVSNLERALTTGVLIYHNIPKKEFPFLVEDRRLLEKLCLNTGILPYLVHGTVFNIEDLSLLDKLDQHEGITTVFDEGLFSGSAEIPLADIYVRKKILITIADGTEHLAWAYVANPDKDHSERLVGRRGKISTKVVIPGGNWRKYIREHSKQSLQLSDAIGDTFGTETEFAVTVSDSTGTLEKRLFQLTKTRGLYRVKFDDDKTLSYENLRTLLSQLLFSSLSKQGRGLGVLSAYYEPNPFLNKRFLIPGGFAYVEGEAIESDGRKVGIQRVPDLLIQFRSHTEPMSIGSNTYVIDSDLEDRTKIFFEVSGFATRVEKGFAISYTFSEMIRRYHLALALEQIRAVIGRKGNSRKVYDQFAMSGNSTQYNIILNPKTSTGVDLSRTSPSCVYNGTGGSEEHSRYTCTVAEVLSKTYGPLLSYLLSGSTKGYMIFQPRPDNRLEYRNTVINNPRQFAAGLAVYVAAVETVEAVIKTVIMELAADRYLKDQFELSPREIGRVFEETPTEMFLSLFQSHFPVELTNGKMRAGISVDLEGTYHGTITDSAKNTLTYIQDGVKVNKTVTDVVMTLFNDPQFNSELRRVSTPEEYALIERYITNPDQVEVYKTEQQTFDSNSLSKAILEFSGFQIVDHYQNSATFPEFATKFLFKERGEYQFMDGQHRLSVELDHSSNPKESSIFLDSLPLVLTLYKPSSIDGSWDEVDCLPVRITPNNFTVLETTIQRVQQSVTPVWHAFYNLK